MLDRASSIVRRRAFPDDEAKKVIINNEAAP
jgi:hypothetical protein